MNIFKEVEKNYKDNFEKLGDKRFHFASRLYLWNGDEFAKNKLAELKAEYIGISEKEYSEKIKSILMEDSDSRSLLFVDDREKFFIKYPLLKKYNKILFRNLFCETIYNIDLRGIISKQIKTKDFIELRNSLISDREAIAVLSTHAINYFYTLDYYLREEESFIDPNLFIDIAQREPIFENEKTAILRVYLLTHCMIGESAFYSRGIERNGDSYEKMFFILEDILEKNYNSISLDNKVEFLVCAKLCGKKSRLEKAILSDTENSFDLNEKCFIEIGKCKNSDTFRKGEHRNVLALMAFHLKK